VASPEHAGGTTTRGDQAQSRGRWGEARERERGKRVCGRGTCADRVASGNWATPPGPYEPRVGMDGGAWKKTSLPSSN
jgi:hypothetical protein